MDKNNAIDLLRIHVEAEWAHYAGVEFGALIELVGNDWQWIPLQVQSDDPHMFRNAVRVLIQSREPSTVAFAVCWAGDDERFHISMMFRDGPPVYSMTWDIDCGKLVNFQITAREPRVHEDDDMNLIEPASAAPEAPPVKDPYFSAASFEGPTMGTCPVHKRQVPPSSSTTTA